VQNFITIGRVVFVRRVPENGMFPKESEVVFNTELRADALAHGIALLSGRPIFEYHVQAR
jgi:hypothetical protein